MLALLTDEKLNATILNAMRRRPPTLDAIRVEDIGLRQTDDRVILDRAAVLGRVVVTSDVQTMVGFAYQRISPGLPTPTFLPPWNSQSCLAANGVASWRPAMASKPSEL